MIELDVHPKSPKAGQSTNTKTSSFQIENPLKTQSTNWNEWKHKIRNAFAVISLIICVSIELVSFKATAIAFPLNASFIMVLFCLLHSLAMFLFCFNKIYILNEWHENILAGSKSRYCKLAILRTLSISVIFVAISREIPGSLLIILMQTSMPLSIFLSKFLTKTSLFQSISKAHWTAILLVIIGCVFGLIASITGGIGSNYIDLSSGKSYNAWWYCVIILVCCIPHSISILYQESQIMHDFDIGHHSMTISSPNPIEVCQAWTSLMQSFFTLIATPFLLYLGDPSLHKHFFSDFFNSMHQAFACLFSAQNKNDSCPHGHSQTAIVFSIWLFSSILCPILCHYVLYKISPIISRLSVITGLIIAFVMFCTAFPMRLIYSSMNSDIFDEWLLLAILCSMIGSFMLLIDFNPERSSTLLDDFEFSELQESAQIKSTLFKMKAEHDSLSIEENLQKETVIHERSSDNMVHLLLIENQKQMLREQYQTQLQKYKKSMQKVQRSQSFHAEFYSNLNVMKQNSSHRNNNNNSFGRKTKKKNEKYKLNKKQMKEYQNLLKKEERRKQQMKMKRAKKEMQMQMQRYNNQYNGNNSTFNTDTEYDTTTTNNTVTDHYYDSEDYKVNDIDTDLKLHSSLNDVVDDDHHFHENWRTFGYSDSNILYNPFLKDQNI